MCHQNKCHQNRPDGCGLRRYRDLTVWLSTILVKEPILHHYTKFHEDRSRRWWDTAIFCFSNVAATAMWDFKIFLKMVGRWYGPNVRPSCHISSKLVIGLQRYRDLTFFKMAAVRLRFWKFKILMGETVKGLILHHYAKFREDRSSCCWDIAINFPIWWPPPSCIFKNSKF